MSATPSTMSGMNVFSFRFLRSRAFPAVVTQRLHFRVGETGEGHSECTHGLPVLPSASLCWRRLCIVSPKYAVDTGLAE